MEKMIEVAFNAPLATVLLFIGALFILIAVVGSVAGKIEPGPYGRIAAGTFGLIFVVTGLIIHFRNPLSYTPSTLSTVTTPSKLSTPSTGIVPSIPSAPSTGTASSATVAPSTSETPVTKEKEPNNSTTTANASRAPLVEKARSAISTIGGWGMVFSSYTSLEVAQDEISRASKKGIPSGSIYFRNGYYASIAVVDDQTTAQEYLAIAKTFHPDAYIATMTTWCRNPQPRDRFIECQSRQ